MLAVKAQWLLEKCNERRGARCSKCFATSAQTQPSMLFRVSYDQRGNLKAAGVSAAAM